MEHACAQDMLFFYTFVKNQLYKMTTTENIRKELQDLVDSKYQEFHSALVPGIGNILGVRIPQLRILAKEIAKRDNWRMFVEATDTKFYEETMLQGMVIGLAKMELEMCIRDRSHSYGDAIRSG